MLQKCTPELYKLAVARHLQRLSVEEIQLRFHMTDKHLVLASYLATAQYPCTRHVNVTFHRPVYWVYNDVEYLYPHTLDNIIILPLWLTPEHPDFVSTIAHEMLHIYFRYNASPTLERFMKLRNLCVLRRPRMPGEITNPDTYYHTGLMYEDRVYFVALTHVNDACVKKYYCWPDTLLAKFTGSGIRECQFDEVTLFNAKLPFNQNEHAEEMLAECLSVFLLI